MQLDSLLRVSQNQSQVAKWAKPEILERMLLLQENGVRESSHTPGLWNGPPREHLWLLKGRIQERARVKWKQVYLERYTFYRQNEVCLRRDVGWLVFMGQVISYVNRWEDYFNYLGGGGEISRNWATAHFLAFYGQPWNLSWHLRVCHSAC